ncbi:hypothetical protein QBC39DRAFT_383089 [Podospora conica]|nr:hypothetical protein QBC39DRAFT_383089 [Schizothecium conicum]
MKLIIPIAVALQLSTGALAKDFFIYAGQIQPTHNGGDTWTAFGFFPSRPEQCTPGHDVDMKLYDKSNDVSHGRIGVVCEGDGCPDNQMDPDKITRLEFSTDFGHFTYYSPHNEFVGLDGNVYGHCYPMPIYMNSIDCHMGKDEHKMYRGWSYFWCKSDIAMNDNQGL